MKMKLSAMMVLVGFTVACGSSESAQVQEPNANVTQKQPVPALTKEVRDNMTPDGVLKALKSGNERFLNQTPEHRDLMAQIKDTASGQNPAAVVLSCIDSRIPTEIVLDQGIGDIFNARVAGNIVNAEILGSMEFATAVAGAKLVVVMGHTACGAVKGACDNVELGNVTSLVTAIQPSVKSVAGESCASSDSKLVDSVAEHNVTRTISEIRERSEILANLEKEGKIQIVGAMYDVGSGKVTFQ